MRPIKIAQIGTMHDHAWATLNSILHQPEYFRLVGVAEPEEVGRERFENGIFAGVPHYTIEELLNMGGLEAVAIETQEESATYYAQLFAEKGIHVHLDKPGSQETGSFTRLVETMRSHGTVFQLGYMYRYNPVVMDVLKKVRNGELGEIFSVEAQMSVHHPKEKREWLGKFKGGMTYFLGCHLVDLVLLFQGEPQEVIPLNTCTGQDGLERPEDLGFVVLKYKNGVSFIKSCAAELCGFYRRQLVVTGTKGSVEIKPLELYYDESHRIKTAYKQFLECDESTDPFRDVPVTQCTDSFDRYDTMMAEFARYIRGEKANPYTYDYELTVFGTLMKCCGVGEEKV